MCGVCGVVDGHGVCWCCGVCVTGTCGNVFRDRGAWLDSSATASVNKSWACAGPVPLVWMQVRAPSGVAVDGAVSPIDNVMRPTEAAESEQRLGRVVISSRDMDSTNLFFCHSPCWLGRPSVKVRTPDPCFLPFLCA